MENGEGGGIFHNGELFRGSYGYAGEFGHLLSPGEPPPLAAQQTRRPSAHSSPRIMRASPPRAKS